MGNTELGQRRETVSFSIERSGPSTQKESTFHAELSQSSRAAGGWAWQRQCSVGTGGGRARAWPKRYIIREQQTSVPYNQNSAAAAEEIFLSADVMDRWTGERTDGRTDGRTD